MTSLGGAPRDPSQRSKIQEFYMINPSDNLSGPSLDWLGSAPVRPTTPKRRVVEAHNSVLLTTTATLLVRKDV